jgi:hypothetical protein
MRNGASGNEPDAFIDMGENATIQRCEELCAGYPYFGLQYGRQCFLRRPIRRVRRG